MKKRKIKSRRANKKRLQRQKKVPKNWVKCLPWKSIAIGVCTLGFLIGWMLQDPAGWFRLQKVEVTGMSEHISKAEVLKRAAPPFGAPLMSLDLERIRKRLEILSWVRSAGLRRLLPDTLYIHIQEHVPVALLALPELYLVSRRGSVFKRLESQDPKDLPVITGLKESQKHKEWLQRRVAESVKIINTIQVAAALHPYGLSELHWNEDETISLITLKDPLTILLGGRPWHDKLDRLIQVFSHIQRKGKQPKLVSLDRKEGVIVRYSKKLKEKTYGKKRR